MDPYTMYLQAMQMQGQPQDLLGLGAEVAIEVPDSEVAMPQLAPPLPSFNQQPQVQTQTTPEVNMQPQVYGYQDMPAPQVPTPQMPQMMQNQMDNTSVGLPQLPTAQQSMSQLQMSPGGIGFGQQQFRSSNNANLAQQRQFQNNFTNQMQRF